MTSNAKTRIEAFAFGALVASMGWLVYVTWMFERLEAAQ